jgi:hypothetical protein
MKSFAFNRCRWLAVCLFVVIAWGSLASPAKAGSYLVSAHGDSVNGVNSSALDIKFAAYATGNCAHCHQMHTSIEGSEPEPLDGPASHVLFAIHKMVSTQNPYEESDNFCFYCHSNTGPAVINQDYSSAFGGSAYGLGPQSIMAAFNLSSYHNLYDIWKFLQDNAIFPEFGATGNPCVACHNSHLAKRNWDSGKTGFPLLSAISKPDDHSHLWGEIETMQSYTSYEAPYASGLDREPAGDFTANGTKTPDYVAFCTVCHNTDSLLTAIWSTDLSRDIKKINWDDDTALFSDIYDKHGTRSRDGTDHFREPYATASAITTNFVLSCLDCHESHGSDNVMMLRRRINGEAQEGAVISTDAMSYTCKRCHNDDLAATAVLGVTAGTGQAARWQYVHHDAADAPYSATGQCAVCHGAGSNPIACGNCHGHGMDDSWVPAQATGRKTF